MPYNDAPDEEISIDFADAVRAERERLIDPKRRRRNNALRKMKRLYDERFGDDSEERNVISLFLYSGPVYPSWSEASLIDFCQYCLSKPISSSQWINWLVCEESRGRGRSKASVLYSGDGYLDTAAKLVRLLQYLGPERSAVVGVFQVMHHGAAPNWHKGVASAIAPHVSVFSSDPDRKARAHPHAEVLRDFWMYGPVQVDKVRSASAHGFLKA